MTTAEATERAASRYLTSDVDFYSTEGAEFGQTASTLIAEWKLPVENRAAIEVWELYSLLNELDEQVEASTSRRGKLVAFLDAVSGENDKTRARRRQRAAEHSAHRLNNATQKLVDAARRFEETDKG